MGSGQKQQGQLPQWILVLLELAWRILQLYLDRKSCSGLSLAPSSQLIPVLSTRAGSRSPRREVPWELSLVLLSRTHSNTPGSPTAPREPRGLWCPVLPSLLLTSEQPHRPEQPAHSVLGCAQQH